MEKVNTFFCFYRSMMIEEGYMHLEASEGRFAEVYMDCIHVRQVQRAQKVKVYKKQEQDKSTQMAFSFQDNRKNDHFLVVENDDVKVQTVKPVTLEKKYFLQWESKKGEWGILKSVAQPDMVLSIKDNKVTISSMLSVAPCQFRLRSINQKRHQG